MNTQTPEKIDYDPEGSLDVVDIFYSIQGEGPLVGTPAVFIRLAGCNFWCRFCDTDYTTGRHRMSVEDIVGVVKNFPTCSLVVLTGGEPFRQNVAPLISKLGCKVQVETNGTLDPQGIDKDQFSWLNIICSPKTGNESISDVIRKNVSAIKYVIDVMGIDGQDGLPRGLARFTGIPVFVQPMDNEDYNRNVQAAVDSCLKFGYRLSLQIHKIVGIK